MSKSSNPPFRLPDYIRPKRYHLVLKPDLVAETYEGNVVIDIDISKKTDVIYLHSKNLNILQVFIRQGKTGFTPKLTYIKKDNTIKLELNKKIIGTAEISISFTGIISNDLRGFYISKYIPAGKEKEELIGATQFEAIDARRAFPCFDEPNMKAVFSLEMITEKGLTVLANTEQIEKNNLANNKTQHIFAPSPKMSTYLLAWVIGKLETVSTAAKNGTMVRVHTPLGKKSDAKFALQTASKVLSFFEDYFGIEYPLNKLDLVAIPDFGSAAMENWGLITFREACLLVDKNNTAIVNMQRIALVIAHEIAHQWFGNLVTMEWWDDLWLNEGFANYIEYVAIDEIFPEWHIWDEFTQDDMGDALRLDALESSHPIEVAIEDAHDIDEIFDDITYRKGASVIRMLAEYIGHKNFQKGIRSYMKANLYKNATTKNLWMHLEKSSKMPVSRVMGAWTRQAGFPVISMEHSGKITKCKQCRYYKNRALSKKNSDSALWPVPLNDGKENILLSAKETNNIKINPNAVTLNANESTLVHIDYSVEFIAKQKDALKEGKLSPIQRMGLIRNMRALAENGSASAIELLEYLEMFSNETNHLVLSELWGAMLRLLHVFGRDEMVYNLLKDRYLKLFSNMWVYCDYETNKHAEKLRSTIVLASAYTLSYEPLVNDALQKFRTNTRNIPPHLRAGVYRIVVRYGNENDKKALWLLLEKQTLHEEKMRIMASFSAVVKARDMIDVLDYYNSDKVRKQDTPLFILRLLNETKNPEIVWNYVEHHWGEFLNNYGNGGHLLSRIVSGFAVIRDEDTLKQMKSFFKKYPAPGIHMTLAQTYEKIEGSILYYKSDARKLESYLHNEKNS